MTIDNMKRREPVRASRNWIMSGVWFCAGVVLVGFGLLPWMLVLFKGNGFNWVVVGVLTIWSALPLSLSAFLLFISLCRIQITADDGEIGRHKSIGPILFRKYFAADHIQLGTHVVWGKRGKREHAVLFIYDGLKKRQILLWDLECRDLRRVGKAVAQAGKLKYSEK